MQFPAEIVAGIRDAVGPGFPISLRFSQWKEVDYDARIVASPDELETMLRILRDAGVDIRTGGIAIPTVVAEAHQE